MSGKKYKLPGEVKLYLDKNPDPFFSDFTLPEDLEPVAPPPEGVSTNDWSKENGLIDQHLEYLRGLMSRYIYDSKKHVPVLAEKWNLKASRVSQLAEEASRQLKLLQGNDDPRARESAVVKLNRVGEKAEAAKNWMAAGSCYKMAADLSVEPRAQKIDIKHEIAMKSDAELDAHIQKLLGMTGTAPALPEKNDIPDAEFTEEPPVSPEVAAYLKSIPESPRNPQGDRVTPLMPDDDE